VTHLAPNSAGVKASNPVDKDDVPIPHFGIVLPMDQWKELAAKLTSKGVDFIIEPKIRFAGEVGEQATMFFLDPSGNALEFKGFNDFSLIFAKDAR
jgi:extradiol dioxygenase family protein